MTTAERAFGPFDLSGVQLSQEPFRFFGRPDTLRPDVGGALLAWLEHENPKWKDHGGAYYTLQDFSLLKARSLPERLECLRAPETCRWLRAQMADVFAATLGEQVDIDAHRMKAPDKVGIHNDFREGRETHRLLLFVGHDWAEDQGGVLLFFDTPPRAPQVGFPPLHLLAIGFEISPRSYHAVSPVLKGVRYSLVYSFYGAGGAR
jgi:hypothetical protein